MSHWAQVQVPVLDIRRHPKGAPLKDRRDPEQESQVLFGEILRVIEEKDRWSSVVAEEQSFCHPDGSWAGYPGWVLSAGLSPLTKAEETALIGSMTAEVVKDPNNPEPPLAYLSVGSRVTVINPSSNWTEIKWKKGAAYVATEHFNCPKPIEGARRFIDSPYVWGGRSAPQLGGVDCSGLVNLSYRLNGVDLPRNAHDQFLRCQRLTKEELAAGDLVFLDSRQSGRVDHVMLYTGEGSVIEAQGEADCTREINLSARLAKLAADCQVFYGRIQN